MNPGLQSHFVDQRTCSAGGLRKTSPAGADGRAGSRRRPGRRSSRRPTAVCASSRARCIPMQTWGPRAKARCWRAFSRRTSKRSGSANALGSRLAAATETLTRSPRRIARAAQLDVGRRVPIDHRGGGLEAQGLLDRVGQQAGVHRHERELVRVREQVHDRVGDHALGRLDAAEEHHRGVGDDRRALEAAGGVGEQRRAGPAVERRRDGGLEVRERRAAGCGHLAAGRDLGDRGDDRVVPAQDGAGVGLGQSERVGHDRRG